jgi:sugar lactone lactonase YvrE
VGNDAGRYGREPRGIMGIVIDYTKGFFEASPSGETVGDISGNATLDLSSGNVFSHTPTANTTFVFSNPPASGTAQGFTLKVTGADVTVGYDLANASYDSVSFSVTGQTIITRGLFFKPDGAKMYVVDLQFDRVLEYDLATAWDVSTASFLQNLSVNAQDTSPADVFFKPDGIKMYVLGDSGNGVNEYDLSTAWNISTASFLQVFSVSAQEVVPQGLFFKPDGTKMYIIGVVGDDVNEYDLSTAWDISTASYVQNFSVAAQDTNPTNISFKPDGTRMFVVGYDNDAVSEYLLSSAWDISTASYLQNFSVGAQQTQPQGLFFKADGLKMYVSGDNPDSIFQYTTGTGPTPATIAYPASVDWPSGTAPDAPADGETDVLVFYTQDGGTTYYGFQVGDSMA